jgi:two-component system phosphate regulon response regulator PhoB
MSIRKTVLVVDDERDLAELLSYNLRKSGYEVVIANSGRQALAAVEAAPPDLILLDVMLPELSGIEVAGRLRANPRTSSIPIVMLTAKTEEVDQIVGLTVGADDYITKPFSMKVLLARVDAVIRRTTRPGTPIPTPEERLVTLGPVACNPDTHETTVDGTPIKLTLTEFRLLTSLVQAQGRVLSRATLMSKAMGPGVTVTERTIDVHITAIRKKLGARAGMIKTVRGVGYRVTAEAGDDADMEEAGTDSLMA